jgi:soluble lytic murein transglycosylase
MRPSTSSVGAGLFLLAGCTLPLILDCYAGPDARDATGALPPPERVFVAVDGGTPAQDPEQIQQRERADEPPAEKLVLIGPAFTMPSLPLSEQLRGMLNDRDYAAAARAVAAMDTSAYEASTLADHSFLLAWLRIHQGQAEEALALLDGLAQEGAAPEAYRRLVTGELLMADDRPKDALASLEGLGDAAIAPRAMVQLAEAYYALERTADSRAVYTAMIEREDPADGNALALLTLAKRAGLGSDEAYPLLRRIWRAYPHSPEDGEARKALAAYEARGGSFRASVADKAARADALMAQRRHREAIQLLEPVVAGLEPSPEACQAWYVYGRSQYRINHLTNAHATLAPAGERCVEHDQDRGAKSLYLAGKAMERKKEWGVAATIYERIPALYPEHSMADDGYALAGIGYQESGAADEAMERWATQVQAYPEGDMAGEGFWRLAWNSYRGGDTAAAISWVDQAAETLELQRDPVHFQAASYWRWRWRLYPDRDAPSVITQDEARRAEAIQGLLDLCRDHPASYYGLLAAGRLQELAPQELAALPHPAWGASPGAWQVRQSFLATPAASNALALARVGLLSEAVTELNQLVEAEMIPGEIGVFAELMVASDQWLWAHDRLRSYLAEHPPETLEHNRARLLTTAYMRRYEREVQSACAGYPWDYRLFHALVREESNFNKDIVSHAGARGLSQLMPATARSVARWLGTTVSDQGMFDPATNLRIGGRYLHFLMERYQGDPFVSLAGYNAGEGNVDKWLRERGNRPVDEFVEDIPFRETRHYVKRVSASWQMYHLLYDGDAPFPALSAFNHQAVPE